jgi:1-acyl-sn-glycerol-3-phosphate acyltransferase
VSHSGHASHGEPTLGQRVLYRFVRAALLAFAKVYFRLSVEGRDKVPDEPFILSPIHRSNLDFLVVLTCTPRRMRYLAKDTLWKPGFRTLFTALGGIPVARGTADREALHTCIEVLGNGESLVIFPEGTRQTGPEICPLFDGPAYVQSRTGAPIVPVGIGGSEAAMPKGAKFLKPHKIHLVIGDPLPAPHAEGAKARRSSVRPQTEALGREIQLLFDEAQRQAGTPNRRELHPAS